jgi:hypothetical protein
MSRKQSEIFWDICLVIGILYVQGVVAWEVLT